MRAKQASELMALQKKIKTGLDEQTKERGKEEGRINLKFNNIEKELKGNHDKEILAFRGHFRSKGGQGSPLLLSKSKLLSNSKWFLSIIIHLSTLLETCLLSFIQYKHILSLVCSQFLKIWPFSTRPTTPFTKYSQPFWHVFNKNWVSECLESPKSDKFLYIFVKMCICSIPVKALTLLT